MYVFAARIHGEYTYSWEVSKWATDSRLEYTLKGNSQRTVSLVACVKYSAQPGTYPQRSGSKRAVPLRAGELGDHVVTHRPRILVSSFNLCRKKKSLKIERTRVGK